MSHIYSEIEATMNYLFGSKKPVQEEKKDPAALAKEWRRNLAKEARSIERDVSYFTVEIVAYDAPIWRSFFHFSQSRWCLGWESPPWGEESIERMQEANKRGQG